MLSVDVAAQRGSFRLQAQFQLVRSGVIALFGRSGSGKTTLVNIVAGLVRADTGTVTLNDTVLFDAQAGIDVPPEHRHIGYVFQDSRLFPHLRVDANLRYALKRARGASYVRLDDIVSLLDLQSLMGRRTHQLSGGEAQRVSIGRALLTQPSLLLLDEPLASLDGARRDEVLPYLEALRDSLKIPMIYVSHRFDEVVRLATHIVLMESGTSIAQGDVGAMSINEQLRALVGPDEVATIIDALMVDADSETQLMRVRVGHCELKVAMPGFRHGASVRLRLLARDVIVATQEPRHLSVRNSLTAVVTAVTGDQPGSDLVTLDIGGTAILARVTKDATRELSLRPGLRVWALVKAVSVYSYPVAT